MSEAKPSAGRSPEKVATRPLPSLKELDTAPFWQGTAEHQLRYPVCNDCSTVIFYPRAHCTSCASSNLRWEQATGTGTVYTFSIVRQSYHPFFRALAPYAVAWIDLDEGPRLVSNVVGVAADAVTIGMRVQVEWEQHEELCIPLFKPR